MSPPGRPSAGGPRPALEPNVSGKDAPPSGTHPIQERPSEIHVGSRFDIGIEDVGFGGEGVGRKDGFVVFVPFVLEGEVVTVEVIEVKRHFARAKLIDVLRSSPDRVSPRCAYYGECGGCQYQHVRYEAQLEMKRRQVASLFEHVGGFAPHLIEPVIPCPVPYQYRNRLMVRSQWDKRKQGLNIGFLRAQDRLVVDIERCEIAQEVLNDEIAKIRARPPPRGGLKVAIRVAPEDWDVPHDSFFQNNFFLLPKLVETVRGCLKENGARFLIDAYCGVGFFSVELADLVESYVGVEIDKAAILAARRNAIRHNRSNGEFIEGSTDDWLPSLLRRFPPKETCVLLDPPRRGCQASSLALLRQWRPAQVIHVSCHPATLARDTKRLCLEGLYNLKQVLPLDMFPQTQHVECVADLRSVGQNSTH